MPVNGYGYFRQITPRLFRKRSKNLPSPPMLSQRAFRPRRHFVRNCTGDLYFDCHIASICMSNSARRPPASLEAHGRTYFNYTPVRYLAVHPRATNLQPFSYSRHERG